VRRWLTDAECQALLSETERLRRWNDTELGNSAVIDLLNAPELAPWPWPSDFVHSRLPLDDWQWR
jgi:hypothetical protein